MYIRPWQKIYIFCRGFLFAKNIYFLQTKIEEDRTAVIRKMLLRNSPQAEIAQGAIYSCKNEVRIIEQEIIRRRQLW